MLPNLPWLDECGCGLVCRHWIWIGVGYLWFFWFVLTTLTVAALKFLDPEKARPSVNDGASAALQLTMQQRVMKAVSLKSMSKRERTCTALCITGGLLQGILTFGFLKEMALIAWPALLLLLQLLMLPGVV